MQGCETQGSEAKVSTEALSRGTPGLVTPRRDGDTREPLNPTIKASQKLAWMTEMCLPSQLPSPAWVWSLSVRRNSEASSGVYTFAPPADVACSRSYLVP